MKYIKDLIKQWLCQFSYTELEIIKNEAVIPCFDKVMKANCDRKCYKAWGINNRLREHLSDDPDDFFYYPDSALGIAPAEADLVIVDEFGSETDIKNKHLQLVCYYS